MRSAGSIDSELYMVDEPVNQVGIALVSVAFHWLQCSRYFVAQGLFAARVPQKFTLIPSDWAMAALV